MVRGCGEDLARVWRRCDEDLEKMQSAHAHAVHTHAVYLGEDGDERDGHAGHARQHGTGTEQREGARREAGVDVRLPQQLAEEPPRQPTHDNAGHEVVSRHRDAEDADRQHKDHSEQARESARREQRLFRLARLVPREDELDDPLLAAEEQRGHLVVLSDGADVRHQPHVGLVPVLGEGAP